MKEKSILVVKVSPGLEYECIALDEMLYAVNDHVVISCERFTDYGKIVRVVDFPTEQELEATIAEPLSEEHTNRKIEGKEHPSIDRLGIAEDLAVITENKQLAEQYLHIANEMTKTYQLEMKFINAHCSFDRRLVIFQFTSEGRIDFRQLLRDLSNSIHARVELRQVGVRDETTIVGGIAPCGRTLCCAGFINKFISINVKMAKEQGLSLNPSNISGVCGRLKCCLAFEYENYKEQRLSGNNQSNQTPNQDGGKDCCCNGGCQVDKKKSCPKEDNKNKK